MTTTDRQNAAKIAKQRAIAAIDGLLVKNSRRVKPTPLSDDIQDYLLGIRDLIRDAV